MLVLVSGSAGRIGSRTVSELLNRGFRVRGFDLSMSGRTAEGFDEYVGSLHDAVAVARAVEGVEALLHLGALMSWDRGDSHRMFRANCEGTHVLAAAAAAAGVKRFVFASSGEVYPENTPVELPISETHPRNPNTPYGLTKLLGEEIVQFHRREGLMETVILRFGHTQDASELLDERSFFSGPRFFLRPRIQQQERLGNCAIANLLRKLDPGVPAHILSRNEEGRPFQMHFTDTRDIVSGILLALESSAAAGETYNLGSTHPVDFDQLLVKMSKITGYPVVSADLPGRGVHYHTSNAKIRGELGFEPEWTIDHMLYEAAAARLARIEDSPG